MSYTWTESFSTFLNGCCLPNLFGQGQPIIDLFNHHIYLHLSTYFFFDCPSFLQQVMEETIWILCVYKKSWDMIVEYGLKCFLTYSKNVQLKRFILAIRRHARSFACLYLKHSNIQMIFSITTMATMFTQPPSPTSNTPYIISTTHTQ